MLPVVVQVDRVLTHSDREFVDGTTQKTVTFRLTLPDKGWIFSHSITDGSRLFDEQINKLQAHGGMNVNWHSYKGDEPAPEWKNTVIRLALEKSQSVKWDGGLLQA